MKVRLTQAFPNFGGGTALPQLPSRRKDYRLISLFMTVTTGAPVANRVPIILVNDGVNGFIMTFAGLTIPASKVVLVTFAEGLHLNESDATGPTNVMTIPIPPDVWVRPQWSVLWGLAGGGDATDSIGQTNWQTESVDEPVLRQKQKPQAQEAGGG